MRIRTPRAPSRSGFELSPLKSWRTEQDPARVFAARAPRRPTGSPPPRIAAKVLAPQRIGRFDRSQFFGDSQGHLRGSYFASKVTDKKADRCRSREFSRDQRVETTFVLGLDQAPRLESFGLHIQVFAEPRGRVMIPGSRRQPLLMLHRPASCRMVRWRPDVAISEEQDHQVNEDNPQPDKAGW